MDMSDKKNVKEALKEMFLSGELSVEVVKDKGNITDENDYFFVAVKIDNEIVCQKNECVKSKLRGRINR